MKYEFTNWTEDTFTGRFGGVNYTFAPMETRTFDPDKHYMLLTLAKQLGDRELIKRVKAVGRDQKDSETWGKSLGEDGKVFTVTKEMRKEMMRHAVGELVDIPVPTPDDRDNRAEAGSTRDTNESVSSLKSEVAELKELVQALVNQKVQVPRQASTPIAARSETPTQEPVSMTREVLESMATDLGINDTIKMTKEELIHAVSSRNQQI